MFIHAIGYCRLHNIYKCKKKKIELTFDELQKKLHKVFTQLLLFLIQQNKQEFI